MVWLSTKFDAGGAISHANPLDGREIVGAALNRLLRLAFALVKNQTYYRDVRPVMISAAV
jgi:hypothetical protein